MKKMDPIWKKMGEAKPAKAIKKNDSTAAPMIVDAPPAMASRCAVSGYDA